MQKNYYQVKSIAIFCTLYIVIIIYIILKKGLNIFQGIVIHFAKWNNLAYIWYFTELKGEL